MTVNVILRQQADVDLRYNPQPCFTEWVAKNRFLHTPFVVVGVGASPEQGIRFADDPRRAPWIAAAGESLTVYLFETPQAEYSPADRERLAAKLRTECAPPRAQEWRVEP